MYDCHGHFIVHVAFSRNVDQIIFYKPVIICILIMWIFQLAVLHEVNVKGHI